MLSDEVAMAVPATKADQLLHELSDPANLVSEFRLHQIRREVLELYAQGVLEPAFYHHLLNEVAWRLGDTAAALSHAQKAASLNDNVMLANNAGVALMDAGDFVGAARCLAEAAARPDGHTVTVLTNLAEAFGRMGAWPEARETFAAASDVADVGNSQHLYRLAEAAGSVGLYRTCVDLFARMLAVRHGVPLADDALAFIDACPEDWWVGLRVPDAIAGAVDRVRAVREGVPFGAAAADDDESLESALDAFMATAPARTRATRRILDE
jgi:Flp pilus assembly protein TadD